MPLSFGSASKEISQRSTPYSRDDFAVLREKNGTVDNVIFVHNCIATWHSLLEQEQSKSLAATGSREILARAAHHIIFGDPGACVDGLQHDQGVQYFGGNRGRSSSMKPSLKFQCSTLFPNHKCTYTTEWHEATIPSHFKMSYTRISTIELKRILKIDASHSIEIFNRNSYEYSSELKN